MSEVADMGDRLCPNCGTVDLVEKGLRKWKCLRCEEEFDEEYLDESDE